MRKIGYEVAIYAAYECYWFSCEVDTELTSQGSSFFGAI